MGVAMADYRVIKHSSGDNVVPISRNIVLGRSEWGEGKVSYSYSVEGIQFIYSLTEDEYWKLRAELLGSK